MRAPLAASVSGIHWGSEPLLPLAAKRLDAVCDRLPSFERVSFGNNPRLDAIVGSSNGHPSNGMPVATVSKSYELVQHRWVLEAMRDALEACDIDPAETRARIWVTELGTRMAARVRLPWLYSLEPDDRQPIDLTFECFNSVDGSVPLFALLGWFRLVCRNGLVIGTAAVNIRRKHTPALRIEDLERVLREGLASTDDAAGELMFYARAPIPSGALIEWVDGPLAAAWGALAASRVYHILPERRRGQVLRNHILHGLTPPGQTVQNVIAQDLTRGRRRPTSFRTSPFPVP